MESPGGSCDDVVAIPSQTLVSFKDTAKVHTPDHGGLCYHAMIV